MTTKLTRGWLHGVVKCLAFIVVWFIRTIIGVFAFGAAGFIGYQGYKDWPTPLYALLFVVGAAIVAGAGVFLYGWAKNKLDT